MTTDNIAYNNSEHPEYTNRMDLTVGYMIKRVMISVKAKSYRRKGNSEKLVDEWEELKLDQLRKEYNKLLNEMEGSRN